MSSSFDPDYFNVSCTIPMNVTYLAVPDNVMYKVNILSKSKGEILSVLPQRNHSGTQTGVKFSDIRHTHSGKHLNLSSG